MSVPILLFPFLSAYLFFSLRYAASITHHRYTYLWNHNIHTTIHLQSHWPCLPIYYLSSRRYYYVVKKGWLLYILHSSRPLQYRYLSLRRQSTIGINTSPSHLPFSPHLNINDTPTRIYMITLSRGGSTKVDKQLARWDHLKRCYCWASTDNYALCIIEFTSTSSTTIYHYHLPISAAVQ